MSEAVIKCENVYKIFGANAQKMLQEANGNAVGAKSYAHYISKKKEVKLVER